MKIENIRKNFGLIGKSLRHSFSADYFNSKFDSLGIRCKYSNFELDNIKEIETFLNNIHAFCGFNITIPYKQSILKYVDGIFAENVLELNAANTILVTHDNKLNAFNTDQPAFETTLKNLIGSNKIKNCLIIGTGASSQMVSYTLKKTFNSDINIFFLTGGTTVINESIFNAEDLKRNYSLLDFDLIVNASPIGMYPEIDTFPPLQYETLDSHTFVYDLVYNPSETILIKIALSKGCRCTNGKEMLILQAEAAWEIWKNYWWKVLKP